MVIYDLIPEDISCDKVSVDESLLVEELILEIYYEGFKKIGFISQKEENFIKKKEREGYKNALKSKGLQELLFEFKWKNNSDVEHLICSLERIEIEAIIISDFSLAFSIVD